MKLSNKKRSFQPVTASTDVYSQDILKMQGNWAAPKKLEQALRDEISADDTVIEVKATYTPERDTTIIAFKYIDKSATEDFVAVNSSTDEESMMSLRKRVKEEKKIAKAYNLKSIEEWCNQAIYMIDTYAGTSHEAEVRADIERMLKKLK